MSLDSGVMTVELIPSLIQPHQNLFGNGTTAQAIKHYASLKLLPYETPNPTALPPHTLLPFLGFPICCLHHSLCRIPSLMNRKGHIFHYLQLILLQRIAIGVFSVISYEEGMLGVDGENGLLQLLNSAVKILIFGDGMTEDGFEVGIGLIEVVISQFESVHAIAVLLNEQTLDYLAITQERLLTGSPSLLTEIMQGFISIIPHDTHQGDALMQM